MTSEGKQFVRVTKLEAQPDAKVKTATMEEWKPGEWNDGFVPPIGNVSEGYLQYPIVLNKPVLVLRTKRNGVEALGLFRSSPVKELVIQEGGVLCYTENSVYNVEYIDDVVGDFNPD